MVPKSIKNISLLLIAIVFAGCASIPSNVTKDIQARYKRIGVVSVAAQKLLKQHVGFTVFGNESEALDISSWNIDSQYVQQITKELLGMKKFELVEANYSAPAFLHINDLNGPWDAPAFRGPNWVAIEKPVKEYCAHNQVDAIVLTFASSASDFIGNSNQTLHGTGIYTQKIGRAANRSLLHLMAGVAILDCTTAQPTGVANLAKSQKGLPGTILRASPTLSVPPEISHTPLSQLSTQQIEQLKELLKNLPSTSWAPTIHSLLE